MPPITQNDLKDLNASLEKQSPQELLAWACEVFGAKLAILSAMQMAGSVVCHMAHALGQSLDVLFVDTGVNFQETLDTRDRIASEYGLNVRTLHPEMSMVEQTRQYGILYLSAEGQRQCCDMRKTQPLLKLRGEYHAFVGSLRRSEGERRGNVPIVALDPAMNVLRVNILANMTNEQMDEYIAQHRVIINPLHQQGFTTIGCNRCTTPVLPEEPHRAGRWRHLGPWAVYCGINPTDLPGAKSPQIDLPPEVLERLLKRDDDFAI